MCIHLLSEFYFFCVLSYYRLGENAEEKDAEEIIDLASKASVDQQQKQVQENVHYQLRSICQAMDSFLHPDSANDPPKDPSEGDNHSRRSGLSFAVGGVGTANKQGTLFLLSGSHWCIALCRHIILI